MKKMQPSPLSGMYRRHQCYAIPLATAILQSLRGDVPAACLNHLKNKEWSGYVSMKLDPSSFIDASDFRDAYLAVEILSKFPSWDLGISPADEALKKFEAAERSCEMTNHRLVACLRSPSIGISAASVIFTARRKIERLLGPLNWDEASRFFAFGPGATFSTQRKYGDAYHKLGRLPEVTKGCAALGYAVLKQHPGWLSHLATISGSLDPVDNLTIVPGNRITTVPKNAKTDRVIAVEPLMNMFIQKGLGAVIRRRLKRVGIDLNTQEHNQHYARVGSMDGSWATIDLSSASDTISLRLCQELLPPDWMSALEQSRCPSGVLPSGEMIQYQKVSSMGNGFTFELESLIFWALVKSTLELHNYPDRHVLVYGDDIIVSSDSYGHVVETLEMAGFTVNLKKSFATGPFRESCGKHYFMGHDVSPFYIREDLKSPDRLILALNNLRRFAARLQPYGLDGRFQSAYDEFRHKLPPWFRNPRIPDGYGDGLLFGDFSEVRPDRAPLGYEGWKYTTVSFLSKTFVPGDHPILLKSLYSLEMRGEDGGCIETDVPIWSLKPRYKLQKSVASQWEDKGEWL